MEDKALALRAPSDVEDDSDDDEVNYEHLSTEQLGAKINVFVNLCLGNKINASNAFDIDMIGCFSTWLEKKKRMNNSSDIDSFQEIADYLEVSGKVYSYRVDNVSETTSRLVEQFRTMNYRKNMIESEENPAIKVYKPKRPRLMLTTADKLRRKPNEMENMKLLSQEFTDLNYKEIFSWGQPSRYFDALFNDTTLEEEMKRRFNEKITVTENSENYSLDDIADIIATRPICSEFHGFVPEEDKESTDSENVVIKLEGIENRFDPNNHQFQSLIDSNNDVENFNDTGSNDKKKSEFAELLKCVDGVNRDYSFFNPKLLANWKGPKAWKAQAMLNALKSCNPSERKHIISSAQIVDDIDKETETKDNKKRIKTDSNSFKVNWKSLDSINDIMEQEDQSKKTLLARVQQKWHAIDNICDTKSIVVDVKHNSEFLKYTEIQPDWWTELHENKFETSETSLNNQIINECNDEKTDLETSDNICDVKLENTLVEKFEKLNSSELPSDDDDENMVKDFKTESNMSIGDLKQEILKIIDQECVFETDSESEWSTQLSFSDILLKVIAAEPGLTVAIVFVALLHLTNEQGLKLFQKDDDSIYIAKPVNRT